MYKRELHTNDFIREINEHNIWKATDGKEGKEANFNDTLILYDTNKLHPSQQDKVAEIIGVNFDGATFGVPCDDLSIKNLIFINCSFQDTTFTDISIEKCEFERCEFGNESGFVNSTISNSFIHSSYFANTYFSGTELENTTFYNNKFLDSNFQASFCDGAVRFSQCEFINPDFIYCTLYNMSIMDSSIKGGRMMASSFNGSDMRGLIFDNNTEILSCNFEDAHLSHNALPWLHTGHIIIDITKDESLRIPYAFNKTTGRFISEHLIDYGKDISLKDMKDRIKSGEFTNRCIEKFIRGNIPKSIEANIHNEFKKAGKLIEQAVKEYNKVNQK